MIPGLVIGNVPPFSSIQIQHVEGGFLCLIAPGAPVGAKLSGDVAAAMHLFLASDMHTDPNKSSAARSVDLSAPVLFEWPEYTCPEGSVFQATKLARIDGQGGKKRSYMLTYHLAAQGTGHQVVAFNRAAVMDHLKKWLTFEVPGEEPPDTSLLTLSGMRPNPDMDITEDSVFRVSIVHSSRIDDFTGPTPFVARSTEPRFAFGLADEDVLTFVIDELGGDMEGEFAARITDDGWLEFGPRFEESDG